MTGNSMGRRWILGLTLASAVALPGAVQAQNLLENLIVRTTETVLTECLIRQRCNNGGGGNGGTITGGGGGKPVQTVDETVWRDQTALTYFGFDPGPIDGQMGGQTRRAIAALQAYLAVPETGHLTDYERQLLAMGHTRAKARPGQPLRERRAELGALHASLRDGAVPPVLPPPVTPMAPGGHDGGWGPAPELQVAVSMADHCTITNLVSVALGNPVDGEARTNPEDLLDQQFCSARDYVISQGQAASVVNVNQSCPRLYEDMRPLLSHLSAEVPSRGIATVHAELTQLGVTPDQQRSMGLACLTHAYRTDDIDLAVASATVLTASGQKGYAELLGHHVRLGFGLPTDRERSSAWYRIALDDLAAGGDSAFWPSLAEERTAVIASAIAGN